MNRDTKNKSILITAVLEICATHLELEDTEARIQLYRMATKIRIFSQSEKKQIVQLNIQIYAL